MRPIILAMPRPDEGPAPGGEAQTPGFNPIIMLLVVMVLMMVLMPLFSKKERHRRKRLEGLQKHDKVVTSGGIYGTIAALDDGIVTLEIAKDMRIKVKRTSVFDLANVEERSVAAAGKASKAKG